MIPLHTDTCHPSEHDYLLVKGEVYQLWHAAVVLVVAWALYGAERRWARAA